MGKHSVLIYSDSATILSCEEDAIALISTAWEHEATWLALPVQAIHDDFFRLETRLLGNITQKLVNYGLKLAIIGDISHWQMRSNALRSLVYETNRGSAIWFVDDLQALEHKLTAGAH
ncbi:DUF4180 domain-containing protein [Trinickia fusca]|uniref:DUF4180 domain-containing protein n=1 Tax=Trinickia fusca TaxID=2419777 RepID=A0A494XFU2_9BURK|nr:DUF4180 domain-containing protein [Trinickia fusca]